MKAPCLLSPAGSPDALIAAISSRADEVYFGSGPHNARANAKNFNADEFKEAIKLCRLHRVKSNIAVNTLVTDREYGELLDFVYRALCYGADAFIVQDLGLARALRETFPEITLHASTQCACHNTDGAERLYRMGFSRVVLARELPYEEIKRISAAGQGRFRTEIFLHGALCVSHSGMCLMSACIGKRSGNRGLCAQPCRLPYSIDGGEKRELLSLKDLSLAEHMDRILLSGVSCLKIEGRMKGPEYVAGVTKTFRALLDERRGATQKEMRYLEELFSRDGFTDRYFTGAYLHNNADMYGVRAEGDRGGKKERFTLPKIPLSIRCEIKKGMPVVFLAASGGREARYQSGIFPLPARSSPLTREFVRRNIGKLGSTPFCARGEDIGVELDPGLFLTAAQINEIRRAGIEQLERLLAGERTPIRLPQEKQRQPASRDNLPETEADRGTGQGAGVSVRIYRSSFDDPRDWEQGSLPGRRLSERQWAKKQWEELCLPVKSVVYPLSLFADATREQTAHLRNSSIRFGVKLPRVIFDRETDRVKEALGRAKRLGAAFCEISNIGHIALCGGSGLALHGGIGLNIYNSRSVETLSDMGFVSLTLSPELLLAQMRDIEKGGVEIAVCAYGRLPVMVLESCVKKANGGCAGCEKETICVLTDRKNFRFPVIREERFSGNKKTCRNVVFNSLPIKLLNRKDKLLETGARVFCVFEDMI